MLAVLHRSCNYGHGASFWTGKSVNKLGFMRCHLFLYFICNVCVLETRLTDCRMLLDEGRNLLLQCCRADVAFAADPLAVDYVRSR